MRWRRSVEQLPSGLRCNNPLALTIPMPVPLTPLNKPVPPSNVAVCWIVIVNLHERGFRLD
jgi:hypothetical protein